MAAPQSHLNERWCYWKTAVTYLVFNFQEGKKRLTTKALGRHVDDGREQVFIVICSYTEHLQYSPSSVDARTGPLHPDLLTNAFEC